MLLEQVSCAYGPEKTILLNQCRMPHTYTISIQNSDPCYLLDRLAMPDEIESSLQGPIRHAY